MGISQAGDSPLDPLETDDGHLENTPPLPEDAGERYMAAQEFDNGTARAEIVAPESYARRSFLTLATVGVITFTWGLGAGYVLWGRSPVAPVAQAVAPPPVPPTPTSAPALPHSVELPVRYGQLGPWMINAGAFAYDAFVQVYERAGQPLSQEQQAILRGGSDASITVDHANAYFLLNFLWAFGLVNSNPILVSGALVANSGGQISGYASTGGWELAAKPIQQLFASASLVPLNATQQVQLEEAAGAIYRPCCNNATSFPDCNHGMAMLGLLELMAARDASVDEMLDIAKLVNSYWFPSQSQELALYYRTKNNTEFDAIPAREAVGRERFSSSGFAQVHEWLASNGKLDEPSQKGNSCGV